MSAASEGATEPMTDEREREIAYQLGMMLHGKALGLVLITELRGELMRLRAQVASLAKDGERLRAFAEWTCGQHTGSVDGCDIEDEAVRLGLVVKVEVNGPCGEDCECAGYGQWPIDCIRFSPLLDAASSAGETK